MNIFNTNKKNNCFYAKNDGVDRFPILKRLKEEELQKSPEFKIKGIWAQFKLSLSLAATAAAIIGISVTIQFLSSMVLTISAIAQSILGFKPKHLLKLTKTINTLKMSSRTIHQVRSKPVDCEDEKKPSMEGEAGALVMRNSKDAFEWKKKLIQSAEKRIVLSGNYCGGESFNEILELIESRLDAKEALKVVILSSPRFITLNNQSKILDMQISYHDRFQLISTGDLWMDMEQGVKKITNHTKGMVVDGTHCIMGGSGIEDKYAYSEGVGDLPSNSSPSPAGLIDSLLPQGFRDMDFVISGSEIGMSLDQELLKLACNWEVYNGYDGNSEDSVARNMLHEDIDPSCALRELFEDKSLMKGRCKIQSSGPEMSESPYGKLINEQISNAKHHIIIDHMYFHPSEETLDLLAQKVNNGVELTIVTNGCGSSSPLGHQIFGPRNRYNIGKLFSKVHEENRSLVQAFEYGQKAVNLPRMTTLHKKVVVIDDTVIAGSSNLGYKSTKISSDHEINFVFTSRQVAEATREVIFDDIHKISRPSLDRDGNPIEFLPLSKKITQPLKYYRVKYRLLAFRHKVGAWLFG